MHDHFTRLEEQQKRECAEAEPLLREALEIKHHALPSGHPDLGFTEYNYG